MSSSATFVIESSLLTPNRPWKKRTPCTKFQTKTKIKRSLNQISKTQLLSSNVNVSTYSYTSATNPIQTSQVTQNYSSSNSQVGTNQSNFLQKSNVTRYVDTRQATSSNQIKSTKNLTVIAKKRIDVARRLFKMFDKDESGYLTEDEIPFIIEQTYKELGQSYKPSREDVKSYMKMVDTDGDGRISLAEFEQIILRSLKNAGFEIYE